MKKDLKYFMRSTEHEIVTVPGPASIKDEEGNVLPLEIKVLTQEEINAINEKYRDKVVATDKKGNPLISRGEVVWKVTADLQRASRHLIVEALQFPNLRDPELMAHYNCVDVTDMPLKVFRKADEYEHVSHAVLRTLGLVSDVDGGGELEEAKN